MKKSNVRQGNIRRRRPGRKNLSPVIPIAIAVVAVAAIAIVLVIFGGRLAGGDTDGQNRELFIEDTDKLIVMSIEEADDRIIVQTSYAAIEYPFAFSDIIKLEAANYGEYSQLKFNASISGKTMPLYTLNFNYDSGIPAGELTLPSSGEKIGVSVDFYDPQDLTEEEENVFYAALETFNNVLDSLDENDNFEKLAD